MLTTLGIVWQLVRQNWKLVLVVLSALTVLSYIWILQVEVKHYKGLYGEAQLQLATMSKQAQAQKLASEAITKKFEEMRQNYTEVMNENFKEIQRRIALDKELASVKLSLRAIRLFNESKQARDTTPTVEVHDGEATTTEEGGTTANVTIPLTAVFKVVAENDKNHLRCIEQVEDWQNFWTDYEASVAKTRELTNDPTRHTN